MIFIDLYDVFPVVTGFTNDIGTDEAKRDHKSTMMGETNMKILGSSSRASPAAPSTVHLLLGFCCCRSSCGLIEEEGTSTTPVETSD